MCDQVWRIIGKAGNYTVWECSEDSKTFYNVTEGEEPIGITGGYGSIEALLSLKGVRGKYIPTIQE